MGRSQLCPHTEFEETAVDRRLVTDIAAAALLAEADDQLNDVDRQVMRTIADWPHHFDLDECLREGDITLNALCSLARRQWGLARPEVFAAVARLEDHSYLPMEAIR